MLGAGHEATTWTQRLSSSFRYHGYRQLFAGSMLAQTVFRMNDVILAWQMLALTGSAFWVGMVAFANGLPLLLLSPFTGALADRRERRYVVAAGLGSCAAAIVWLAWLTATGQVRPLHIVLTAFLTGSGFTLYSPARLAMLPSLVPAAMLRSASTLEYSSTRLVGFIGPAVAGFLVDRAGAPVALVTGATVILLAATVFTRIAEGSVVSGGRSSGLARPGMVILLREALAYLRTDRPLRSLLLLGLVMVPIGMAHQKMLPVFNRDVLAAGASTLGLMVGLFGLGAAAAGSILAGLGPLRQGRLLLAASLAGAGGVIVFALTRNAGLALALALLLGLVDGVYLTLSNVIFQTRAPDAMRGRVLGAWGMVWGFLPFTALFAGFLAERIGVVAVIAGSGVLCLMFTIGVAVASPQLRELT